MRWLMIAISLMLPVYSLAACTWEATGSKSAKVVCTTGTETAPSGVTAGADMSGTSGFALVIEAVSGQTVSGGTLLAYTYNDLSGTWVRNRGLDQPVPAFAEIGHGFEGFSVTSARGRVAYVPSGVTISSGSLTIYINMVGDMIGPLVK